METPTELTSSFVQTAEANDWLLPQTNPSAAPAPELAPDSSCPTHPYGFLSLHSALFYPSPPVIPSDLLHLGPTSNPNPELTSPTDRLRFAEQAEDAKFDGSYYQGDYVYDEEISEILRWEAPLSADLRSGKTRTVAGDEEYFTEEERKELERLPKSTVDC